MRECSGFFPLFKMTVVLVLAANSGHSSEPLPELIATIHADSINTLFGYQIAPLGDQNNDGFDDFITWDAKQRVYLYFGGQTVDTIADLVWERTSTRFSNIGDVSGDSHADFTIRARSPVSWRLNLYHGGIGLDTIREVGFGKDTLYGVGYTVAGNDINVDGTNEIITLSNFQKSILFYELGSAPDSLEDLILTPANLADTSYTAFGESIISGDFNGDGKCDIGASLRFDANHQKRGSVLFYWGGRRSTQFLI